MLKLKLNRFNNYVFAGQALRSITHNSKLSFKIKKYHKQIVVNSVYLKRQQIKLYSLQKYKCNKKFFFSNALISSWKSKENSIRNLFIWSNIQQRYKKDFSKESHFEFLEFFLKHFSHIQLQNFKYYWLSDFLTPSVRTRFYYYTNNIKYFSNQRLVKQPILISYSSSNKYNSYSNYVKIFKGLIQKKNLNSLFFFKTVFYYIYPRYETNFFFFKYSNFLKKYINSKYLKLMLA